MATWKQVRRFVQICVQLGLDTRPGMEDIASPIVELEHNEMAMREIAGWVFQPVSVASLGPAIARWFAVRDALTSIGVGQEEGTGIPEALDYWRMVGNRQDFSPAKKAEEFARRAGIPEMAVVAFSVPDEAIPQTIGVNPDLAEMAAMLRAAGFSAVEVAQAIGSMRR